MKNSYGYVLYIDEAGDDGLAKIRPVAENGSSEWLVISGVLVRQKYESSVVNWVADIRQKINSTQGPALHYRKLIQSKRIKACEILSAHPLRGFSICSNKKSMIGRNNQRAASRGGKQWFYNYCVRLLMERATDFCLSHSLKSYGEPRNLKVVFSQRGGHSYGQTKAYWELLKNQAIGGSTFLNKRTIKHQVLNFNLVDYVPHTHVAGLQLADIVASAFYQAVNTSGNNWNIDPAIKLERIVAAENGLKADYGMVLQPTKDIDKYLSDDQKTIFKHYGYKI